MTKKLEGFFGLKLGEVLDESKFNIISKELAHGDYHIEIEEPPKPNLLFKDYAVRCTKDMVIEDISACTLSPIAFDKAKERLEVLKNCNCEEYQELELIIKTRGTKIY